METGEQFPGPIDQSPLLNDMAIKFDTDAIKKYTNIKIKDNLIENIDFIVVSNLMWKYISAIYGGIEI
jgi:hypothetical protein